MARKRRYFSPEYKAEVVQLVLQGDKGIGQVARDLELSETAVRSWVNQAKTDAGKGSGDKLTTSELEELRRLRRELKQVRMEREILKKATAFFVKENS